MIVKRLVILKLKILKNLVMLFLHWQIVSLGRVLAADVKDPISGELIFKQGHLIGRDDIATSC